jgi:hypothetical protein
MISLFTRILVAVGSLASIGFGIWHFFVPKAWNWNSYIDVRATELILAVNAINIFFSLSLVLFGVMNALLIFGEKSSNYSIMVVLSATCILWFARVLLQLVSPQGSMSPFLQYSMLTSFVLVFLCYAISLISVLRRGV